MRVRLTRSNFPSFGMKIVYVDPTASPVSALIYQYGEDRFNDGLYSGAIYAALGFTFLLCVREYLKARA